MTDQAITVNTALLKQKLKLVAPYAPAKSPLPITSHIRLDAEGGWLVLRATDLDQTICDRLAVSDGKFSACLPAKSLKKLVDSLKGEDTRLSIAKRNGPVTISSGNHTASLRGMDPADFPALIQTGVCDEPVCSIEVAALKRLADRTMSAASKENTRPVLRGVLFEHVDGTLTATATDGARLATAQESVRARQNKTFTVPAAALKRAVASLADSWHTVEISHHQERRIVVLSSGHRTITIRLIEGTYPNWRQIMPHAFKSHVTVEPGELLHAIKAATAGARLVAPKGGHGKPEDPRVRLEHSELNDLRVSSRDDDGNEFAAHTDADFNGSVFDISFNPAYLVEAIKALVGGPVRSETGYTTSKTRITAATTVTPSRAATAPPVPQAVTTDPMVLASLVASAQIRLHAVETRYGPGTPQYDAANQRLVAARAARKARRGVPTLPSEPPVVAVRKPDPATASVPATGSTIELCFTGPNSACLLRMADGSGNQTHVIMPMHVDSKREPVPGRSGTAEQAA